MAVATYILPDGREPLSLLCPSDDGGDGVVICGSLDGSLVGISFRPGVPESVFLKEDVHNSSIRCLCQLNGRDTFVTASSDRSIKAHCIKDGSLVELWTAKQTHGAQVSSICVSERSNLLFMACENGIVKGWDVRASLKADILRYQEHEDYVADLEVCPQGRSLYSAGGDGRLVVFDIVGKKPRAVVREDAAEELSAVKRVGDDGTLAIGVQDGHLAQQFYGAWDAQWKRIDVAGGVERISVVSEDRFAVGTGEGAIILFNNDFSEAGRLGDHGDMPIVGLGSLTSGRYVVSASAFNSEIRLWDMKMRMTLPKQRESWIGDPWEVQTSLENDAVEKPMGTKSIKRRKQRRTSSRRFFSDM